jgi:cytochrome c
MPVLKNLLVTVALATLLATLGAVAQASGDPAAGLSFARGICAQCHKVVSDQQAPLRTAAPDFARIANMPSTTETALHVFLLSPHPTMPNLILTQQQQEDVIAYILSLRTVQN